MSRRGSQTENADEADEPPSADADADAPDGVTRAAPSVADIQKYLEQTQEKGRKSVVQLNDTVEVKEIDRISEAGRSSVDGGEPKRRPSSTAASVKSEPNSTRTSVDADSQWPSPSEFETQMSEAFTTKTDVDEEPEQAPTTSRPRSASVATNKSNKTNAGDEETGQRSRANSVLTQASQKTIGDGGDTRGRANSVQSSPGVPTATFTNANTPSQIFGFGAQTSPSKIFGEGYTAGESASPPPPPPSNYAEEGTSEKTYKMRKSGDSAGGNLGGIPLPPQAGAGVIGNLPNSRADKEWISKFELFTIKFLNKIFWRARTERRLAEAVKFKSCRAKKPPGFVPTANTGVFPYSTFAPLEGFEESPVDSTVVNNAEEEANQASELNAMLDEIRQVITTIDPAYLPLVTPIFQTHLMTLRNKDFRETDNREIYRRIDDYARLIRCDAHICIETVQSRLEGLNNFLNAVQKDTETLKKFPRILTKCYSTESKICQDVCEVYSDDEFQTVNIKKMCKLKCKQPERPPWRLTYKIGRECYPGYDAKAQAQAAPVKQTCTSSFCGGARPSTCSGGAGPGPSSGRPNNCGVSTSTQKSGECSGSGSGWSKWKNKQWGSGGKNNCCKKEAKPRRDPRCCVPPRKKKKKKKQSECGTSMTNLPGIGILRVPPGLGHKEFKEIMTDFYGTLSGKGGSNMVGSGAYKDGYNMRGMVATQTMQFRRQPPVDRQKLEEELKTKQLQDRSDFEERLKKQREEFSEKQRILWNGFEEHQGTLPFDQIQEHRLQFDQEMSIQRQKFEESILNQWKEFNAKQDQEQKDLEAKVRAGMQGQGPGPSSNNWQVQGSFPNNQTGRYNFTQMNAQVTGHIERGFRNIGMNKQAVQHGQQTQGGFVGRVVGGRPAPVLNSKQQQTFRPYEQFQPITGDELQAELEKCLQVPNTTLTGCLAKLVQTSVGDGPVDFNTKQKEEVYLGFIAQMLAAGNISKEDADKMTNLVKSKMQMERMEVSRNQYQYSTNREGVRQNQREAQCCLANTCPPQRNFEHKFMHICQDGDSCPHGTLRGFSKPAKVFIQTKTYANQGRCDLQQARGWQNPDGTYDTGVLCMSTAKQDNCPSTCPMPKRPSNCSKSQSDIPNKPPAAPLCAVKSYPMVMKSPQCSLKKKYDLTRPLCCDFSLPKLPFKKDKCEPNKANIEPVAAEKISIPEVPPPPPPFRDPTPPPSSKSSPHDSGGSLSVTSLSPTPPTSAHDVDASEDTDTPPQGKKKYDSPFKFKKVAPPDCETSFDRLPECHPLKTPYPPQYRFDEVRMRRYQEQCALLKQICANAPGDQCWTPPPPPLPPELRPRPPPFPPDPCAPNLFPQAGLGMGCSYGLSAGSCYGPFGLKKRPPKPEECFFDCGGVCPMTCPEPEIPVVKKKKKKCDEFFCFDYITVMREKNPKKDPEKEYCDLYKQRQKQSKQCDGGLPTLEIEVEGAKGRRRRGRGQNDNGPPLPNDEITRFLLRPDVHLVKEQKTEIVKKHDCEGQPEKMVSQFEAYYTKNNDGKISTEVKDLSKDPNANSPVDQWIKQDGEATLRKLNRARNCGDECPMRDTDWEKEFREFEKSCKRPKKKRGPNLKPLPAGFLPCPLPDAPAPIMCRVEDPKALGGSGAPTIQCQAIPFPLRNLIGNTLTPDGRCPMTLTVPPFGMPPPPGAYGGYIMGQVPNQVLPPGSAGRGMPPNSPNVDASGGWSNSEPGPSGSAFGSTQPVQKSVLKKKERKSDDYPYMCEIKYHEPIQGSIYGRVVSRLQPCRLIDPDTGLPPDHNPECPVIMETPFFNPSCPQKGKAESKTKTEENKEKEKNQ